MCRTICYVIPGPFVMLLFSWSIILRVREVSSLFLSLLYWGATGLMLVNSSEPVTWYVSVSRTLLSLPSSGLSVLLRSSKLRTISVMHANLSVLMMLSLASSGVVISFFPMDTFSSLSINTLSGSCFSLFITRSTFKGSHIWHWMLLLNMLTMATTLPWIG